jgi:hypothetical protein
VQLEQGSEITPLMLSLFGSSLMPPPKPGFACLACSNQQLSSAFQSFAVTHIARWQFEGTPDFEFSLGCCIELWLQCSDYFSLNGRSLKRAKHSNLSLLYNNVSSSQISILSVSSGVYIPRCCDSWLVAVTMLSHEKSSRVKHFMIPHE